MYQFEIDKIIKEVEDVDMKVEELDGICRLEYLQSISCKSTYFKKYVDCDDKDFYKNVKINQRLSVHDLNNYRKLKDHIHVLFESEPRSLTKKIYCAFHYGSYRAINCALHERNVDFAVVANQSIIKSSQESIMNLHRDELQKSGRVVDFEIINVNANSGILKMMRALKEGKSLLIYIDGNNGLGGFSKNDGKLALLCHN